MSRRMNTVLRMREFSERGALGALARARRDAARAGERVEQRRGEYHDRPLPDPSTLMTPAALRAFTLQGNGALELIQEAAARRDDAEADRERALSAWSLASISRKSTERLVERERLVAAAAARAAADRALDEVVLLQRGRR